LEALESSWDFSVLHAELDVICPLADNDGVLWCASCGGPCENTSHTDDPRTRSTNDQPPDPPAASASALDSTLYRKRKALCTRIYLYLYIEEKNTESMAKRSKNEKERKKPALSLSLSSAVCCCVFLSAVCSAGCWIVPSFFPLFFFFFLFFLSLFSWHSLLLYTFVPTSSR
jgi:hypothetical protein